MMRRNILNSPRLLALEKDRKKKKREAMKRKIILISGIAAVLLVGFSFLSRIERINIKAVEATGNNIIDTEAIREVAESEMKGKYIWLFPKTNVFLYPKSGIEEELRSRFTRFENIDISTKSGNTLSVEVSERAPAYTWCGDMPEAGDSVAETCYFLDTQGYIFDEAPYFSGEVYFKLYGKTREDESESPAGTHYFEKDFSRLILLKERLENLDLRPVTLYIDTDGNGKIFLSKNGPLSVKPAIIFKKDADLEKVAENLQAALEAEPLKSEFKNKYNSLEYLDLRFGNKVYYKFK